MKYKLKISHKNQGLQKKDIVYLRIYIIMRRSKGSIYKPSTTNARPFIDEGRLFRAAVSCDTQVSTGNHVTGTSLTYIFGQIAERRCSSKDGIFDFGLKFAFTKCTLKSGNSDDALQVINCSGKVK